MAKNPTLMSVYYGAIILTVIHAYNIYTLNSAGFSNLYPLTVFLST